MRRGRAAAVVVAAVAAAVLPLPAAQVERWYSTGLYPPIQRSLTAASNALPFALLDVVLVSVACGFAVAVFRSVRGLGWRRGLVRVLAQTLVAASAAYLVFLATWGLNYRRVPMVEKVVFEPSRISRAGARNLGSVHAASLNRLYAAAHATPFSLDALASSFDTAIRRLGSPSIRPGRPKETLLAGYFHEISFAGMTNPFFLETLVASDLLEVERPFVIAHEWAHLAGYADESEANFVAWLASRHGDARAQYSGALAMIGYALPERPLREVLEIGPRIDVWAMHYRYATTSPAVRAAARKGYDTYLKANRVEKGFESYDAVVQLILGTELDADGYPRRR
jgi:hypothetical protein